MANMYWQERITQAEVSILETCKSAVRKDYDEKENKQIKTTTNKQTNKQNKENCDRKSD